MDKQENAHFLDSQPKGLPLYCKGKINRVSGETGMIVSLGAVNRHAGPGIVVFSN